MFSELLSVRRAPERPHAAQSRTQVEHFSQRFPDMTIGHRYSVSRARVQIKPAAWGAFLQKDEIVPGGAFTRPVAAQAGDTFHADDDPLGAIASHFT